MFCLPVLNSKIFLSTPGAIIEIGLTRSVGRFGECWGDLLVAYPNQPTIDPEGGPTGQAVRVDFRLVIFYGWMGSTTREPLLHRLLVRVFGRTCGHSAEKIRTQSGLVGKVGLDEAMDRSVRWYLEERSLE